MSGTGTWSHYCEPRGYHHELVAGAGCQVCNTYPVTHSSCANCLLLQNQLDNARAEIERLGALVRPSDRVRGHLG